MWKKTASTKETKILELEKELYVAHKLGYIFRYTHMTSYCSLGDFSKSVGVEILFSDNVDLSKIKEIKEYIEKKYKFYVDDLSYIDPVSKIKIITVRY